MNYHFNSAPSGFLTSNLLHQLVDNDVLLDLISGTHGSKHEDNSLLGYIAI
jgi:hypothetical protein